MISIIDVEASGFGATSYPIEIGVITKEGQRFCSLIHPLKSWTHWDKDAEKVHGISRELLKEKGHSPALVCQKLNAMLKERTIYSDSWVHDQRWLQRLFWDSQLEMQFHLSPIESMVNEEQLMIWDEVKRGVIANMNLTRHRASGDAAVIQKTFERSRELSFAQRLAQRQH